MKKGKHTLNPNNWIAAHSDYLFCYAIGRIESEELAKDIVQETLFSGLKALKNYRGDASERTWLVSILKRKIVDHYRSVNSIKGKAEIKVNFYQDGDRKGTWLEECVPKIWNNEGEKNIENIELKNAINHCIGNLPERQRMIFLMKNIKHYQTEDICEILGITTANFWVMIYRARLQLRKCLEDNWFAE